MVRPSGVAIYSLDSGEYEKLVEIPGGYCRWLNDSRRLLFASYDRGDHLSQRKLYLLDSVSKEYVEVLDSVDPWFTLSKDNRTIYFTRGLREADIWMLTLNEEQKVQ
jgi:hypothetical protein